MRQVVRPPWLLLFIPLLASLAGCADNTAQAPAAPTAVLSSVSAASAGGLSSGTAAAKQSTPEVPFSGVVTGEVAFDKNPLDCGAGFTAITAAKGPASHLGLTSWYSEHCLVNGSEIVGVVLVLTAANGDEVYGTYTGRAGGFPPQIGGAIAVTGTIVFSGGTGRFEHASGSAELSASVIFEGMMDPSWAGKWEWKGAIRY
jgi:hypothetical protein